MFAEVKSALMSKLDVLEEEIENEDTFEQALLTAWCKLAPGMFIVIGNNVLRWPGFKSILEAYGWVDIFLDKSRILFKLKETSIALHQRAMEEQSKK